MNTIARLMLVAALALPLAACKKEEAPKPVEKPAVAVPTNDDATAWKAYVTDVVIRNMDGVTASSPYVYLLPAEGSADFQPKYEALRDKAKNDIAYGIPAGNMLAYSAASTSSTKIADLVVEAFAEVKPDSLKGVKLLFIGKAADSDRVKAAVEPAGVKYVLIETK